jgi:hypothetical protein
MATLTICDLPEQTVLEHKAMADMHGGRSWLASFGPADNVNVSVNQNITQLQNIGVNALNNVGVIGAGFGPLKLDVSPQQWAAANASF